MRGAQGDLPNHPVFQKASVLNEAQFKQNVKTLKTQDRW